MPRERARLLLCKRSLLQLNRDAWGYFDWEEEEHRRDLELQVAEEELRAQNTDSVYAEEDFSETDCDEDSVDDYDYPWSAWRSSRGSFGGNDYDSG